MADLQDHVTPIVSGLKPCTGGRLSRARAAQLDADLKALERARRRAFVEILNYPILESSDVSV